MGKQRSQTSFQIWTHMSLPTFKVIKCEKREKYERWISMVLTIAPINHRRSLSIHLNPILAPNNKLFCYMGNLHNQLPRIAIFQATMFSIARPPFFILGEPSPNSPNCSYFVIMSMPLLYSG